MELEVPRIPIYRYESVEEARQSKSMAIRESAMPNAYEVSWVEDNKLFTITYERKPVEVLR